LENLDSYTLVHSPGPLRWSDSETVSASDPQLSPLFAVQHRSLQLLLRLSAELRVTPRSRADARIDGPDLDDKFLDDEATTHPQ